MDHEQTEEIKRHFGVVAEGLARKIQQVAEGVVNLNEKLDREMTALRQEMRTEFGEVKSMIKFSYYRIGPENPGPGGGVGCPASADGTSGGAAIVRRPVVRLRLRDVARPGGLSPASFLRAGSNNGTIRTTTTSILAICHSALRLYLRTPLSVEASQPPRVPASQQRQ